MPNPGRQNRITTSLESIITFPFHARTSYVTIPEWGQHCSNCGMPCLIGIFGTIWGTWNKPNENPGTLCRCSADIFSNISNREIQLPGMLVARKIGLVRLVGCTNDWHNCHFSRKLILCILPLIAGVNLAVYSATFRDCEAHRFKINVRLNREICQK